MYEKLTLKNFMSGALEEKFQIELNKVNENLADVNTPSKAVREINIKIKFLPNEERDYIGCSTSVSSKMANLKESTQILKFADSEGKGEFHLFQETSVDLPLFEEKEVNEINIKEAVNG